MTEKKRFEDNQPGMDQKRDVNNDNYEQTKRSTESGEQGRASYHAGSTTQGGSNYGQGSHYHAGNAYHQGDEKNSGSDYANEAGRFSEDAPSGNRPGDREAPKQQTKGKLTEERDDIPHGQGAHVNEKESNAQEDYPGTQAPEDNSEKDII